MVHKNILLNFYLYFKEVLSFLRFKFLSFNGGVVVNELLLSFSSPVLY